MAIKFKAVDTDTILLGLGVLPPTLQKLKSIGTEVTLTNVSPAVLTFRYKGELAGTVNLGTVKLAAIYAGTLHEGTKKSIKLHLDKVIGVILAADGGVKSTKTDLMAEDKQESKSVLDVAPPVQVISTQKAAPVAWSDFPAATKKTAPCVKLRDATHMYQPVLGTSEGSRYYMIGANDDIRIAVRIKGGSLSIRIEGPNWTKYKAKISSVGFNKVDQKNDYASMHLSLDADPILMGKTIGAVLLGLGVPFETPIPDIAKIPVG